MSVEYDKLDNKTLEKSQRSINEYYECLYDIIETKEFEKTFEYLRRKTNDNYWLITLVNHIF